MQPRTVQPGGGTPEQAVAPDRSRRWQALAPWAAGALGAAIFFPSAVFGSAQFLERDMLRVAYPLRRYLVQRLSAGTFPEWFPDDALGQPFVGMLVSGAFHPLNLLYAFLPFDAAFRWTALLAFVAAFAFTFGLARALGATGAGAALAASAYAFSGFNLGITNNLPYLLSAAALPGALLAADAWARRPGALRLLVAGFAAACLLYAGDALLFFAALTVAAALVFLRHPAGARRLGPLAPVAAALALSAAQLLPTLAISGAARSAANPVDLALDWSGHPLLLAEAFLGPLFLDAQGGMLPGVPQAVLGYDFPTAWVPSHAVGAVVVLLALSQARTLAGSAPGRVALVLFALVLAGWLGRFTPLWELARAAVPPVRALRYPDKLWPLLGLGLAVAAGLGLARARASAALGRATAGLAVALFLSAAVEVALRPGRALMERVLPDSPEAFRERLSENLSSALLLSALALALFWLWLKAKRFALFPAAICFGALWAGSAQTPRLADPEWVHHPPAYLKDTFGGALPPRGTFRFISTAGFGTLEGAGLDAATGFLAANAAALHPATGSLFELESANFYLPALTHRLSWVSPGEPAFDAPFNVHYRIESKDARSTAYPVVGELPLLRLVVSQVPQPTPRAYLAWPRCVSDVQAAADFIRSAAYRPGHDAALECSGAQAAEGSPGAASIARYEPEEVEVDIDARPGAVLVLSDAFWPGWTATVDGAPAEILAANVAVRGVRVPAGRHRVRFFFRHPGLREGLAVTAAAALGLLALAAVGRFRRRAGQRP